MEKLVILIWISQDQVQTDQGVPLKLKNLMLIEKWKLKIRLRSWSFLILKFRMRTEKEEGG